MRTLSRWAFLLLVTVLGCALVGYGFLPLVASDMHSEDRLMGAGMIVLGTATLASVVINLRRS